MLKTNMLTPAPSVYRRWGRTKYGSFSKSSLARLNQRRRDRCHFLVQRRGAMLHFRRQQAYRHRLLT
jgi:hypothetical protein